MTLYTINPYLRTLRALHRHLTQCDQGIAQMEEGQSLAALRANRMPEPGPTFATQPVYDARDKARAEYDAHAALHPDLAAEYELRHELDRLQRQHADVRDRLDRTRATPLHDLPPLPPLDLSTLTAEHDATRARLREAVDQLASCDPLSRDARRLPATIARLRDREGAQSIRIARARQRYAETVAARPPPIETQRATLDAECEALTAHLHSLADEIAALVAQLPAGPVRAPLTAARRDGRPRARRAAIPSALTDPVAVARHWADVLAPVDLSRYRYDWRTGDLHGPRGLLAPTCDTVAVTLARRQFNVPKGVFIALLHLGVPAYLTSTLPGDIPHRWAWSRLVAHVAGRDRMHSTVPARTLTDTGEALA